MSDLTPPIEGIKEPILNITDKLAELPTMFDLLSESVLNLKDNLDSLPSINQSEDSPSENPNKENPLTSEINNSILQEISNSINQSTTSMNEVQNYINDVSNRMTEATNSLAEAMSTVALTNDSLSQVKTALDKVADIKVSTPTVNVTQNINEPHAWNNELIQELADKVADKMKNEIIYAIKGSYGY